MNGRDTESFYREPMVGGNWQRQLLKMVQEQEGEILSLFG